MDFRLKALRFSNMHLAALSVSEGHSAFHLFKQRLGLLFLGSLTSDVLGQRGH